MPAVMVGWVSPLVCAADKYGIGIHIQSLLWVVDNPLSTFNQTWLTMEVTAPENVYVGGGSSERSILMIDVST